MLVHLPLLSSTTEKCEMPVGYLEEADDMAPTSAERLAVLENEIKHLRDDTSCYRKESKTDREEMKAALEEHIRVIGEEQKEIRGDIKLLTTFLEQAKGIKWFIGFVTAVASALSTFGVYKLFFK